MGWKIQPRRAPQVSAQLRSPSYPQTATQIIVCFGHSWHFPPGGNPSLYNRVLIVKSETKPEQFWKEGSGYCTKVPPPVPLSAVQPCYQQDLEKQGTPACDRTRPQLSGLLVLFYVISEQYVQMVGRGPSLSLALGKPTHLQGLEAPGTANNAASVLFQMHIWNRQGAKNPGKKGDKLECNLWDELGG